MPVSGATVPVSKLLVERMSISAQINALSRVARFAPSESVNLNHRYRKMALQGVVIQTLTQQLLEVTLQAQRDPNKWVVLDEPWIEEKPSNKDFLRMGLAGLLIGTVLGGLLAVARPIR